MFKDEIVRLIPDDERDVGQMHAVGKHRWQRDSLLTFRCAWFERHFGGIQNDPSRTDFDVSKKLRHSMADKAEETVIRVRKIHVDRFDIGRSGRNNVKIADGQVCEDTALRAKIHFQIFPRRIVTRDLADEA